MNVILYEMLLLLLTSKLFKPSNMYRVKNVKGDMNIVLRSRNDQVSLGTKLKLEDRSKTMREHDKKLK